MLLLKQNFKKTLNSIKAKIQSIKAYKCIKAVLREKFRAQDAPLRKEENYQINNLTSYLSNWKKE
jgi:hypothetical protein